MEKYFDIEQIKDHERVKFECLKLKGHASLRWDNVQANKVKKGKDKMKNLDRMVTKLKDKFLPTDYMICMFRMLQNLRQKESTMK